ncbi:hypothetical protein [Sporosarcina sp. NPDC096371]|uniref:hypothetical protein n=1 Tax=Sporosarcina sp. NPDC096371 TaxID=3364530 RepID=UPI0038152496
MGYLLPIQPIQSQQYANRMNRESYNFAHVDRVGKIKFDFNFSDGHYSSFHHEREIKDEEVMEISIVSTPSLASKGFIYPNPANLSPTIAQAVGKGLTVNVYV